MEPSNRPTLRKAFVTLHEFNAFHKRRLGIVMQIASSEWLCKVTSMVTESCKPYHLYFGNIQLLNSEYFQLVISEFFMANEQVSSRLALAKMQMHYS